MDKLDLSIGILSWDNTKTLEVTLNTYKENGLLDMVDDVVIFFQEIKEEDILLSKKYNLKYIGSQENIGIANGFITLIKNLKKDNILLLEHDWNLIENKETTYSRIKSGLSLLQ